MSTITETYEASEIRRRLKVVGREDFIKAHTKAVMLAFALVLTGIEEGAEDAPSGTKDELYDILMANANLPDPALRGSSSIEQPVAYVWELAEQMHAENPEARRKDVVNQAKEDGVAHYTARTQYQAWFSATGRGTRKIADLEPSELPKAMRPAEPEADDESSDEG